MNGNEKRGSISVISHLKLIMGLFWGWFLPAISWTLLGSVLEEHGTHLFVLLNKLTSFRVSEADCGDPMGRVYTLKIAT
mgnify:CR=1 FL=1